MQHDNITTTNSYSNDLSIQNDFSRNSIRHSEEYILYDQDSKLSIRSPDLESPSTEPRLVNSDESINSKDNHYSNSVENGKTKSNDLYLQENASRSIDTVEHTKDLSFVDDNSNSENKFRSQSIRGKKYRGRKKRRLSYSDTVNFIKSTSTLVSQEKENLDETQQKNRRRVSFNDEKLESVRFISEYSSSDADIFPQKKKKTKKDDENEYEEEPYLWYEHIGILTIFYAFVLCALFYGVVINRDYGTEPKTLSNDSHVLQAQSTLFIPLELDENDKKSSKDVKMNKNNIQLIDLPGLSDNRPNLLSETKNVGIRKTKKILRLQECFAYSKSNIFCESRAPELEIEFDANEHNQEYIKGKIKAFEFYTHLQLKSIRFWYDGAFMNDETFQEVSNAAVESLVISFVTEINWKVGDEFITIKNKEYYKNLNDLGDSANFERSGIIMSVEKSDKKASFVFSEDIQSYDFTNSKLKKIPLNYLRRAYKFEKETLGHNQNFRLTTSTEMIRKICESPYYKWLSSCKKGLTEYAGFVGYTRGNPANGKVSVAFHIQHHLKETKFIEDIPLCLILDSYITVDIHDIPTNKQVSVLVEADDTIAIIRAKIFHEVNRKLDKGFKIKEESALYYNDEYLDPTKTLKDYKYIKGFNLIAFEEVKRDLPLEIKCPGYNPITMDLTNTLTVKDIYDKIPNKDNSLVLKFSGFSLLDKSRTCKSYGMSYRKSPLKLQKQGKNEIIFRRSDLSDIKLSWDRVNMDLSIKELKRKAKLDNNVVLIYNRKVLKDHSKSLSYYKYTPNAEIYYK